MVEDSENDALLILRQFKREGYDITSRRVENADQMKKAFEDRSWDLVLSDYNLPEFNVTTALKIFREVGHDIPFIVVSGVIPEGTAVDLMKAGAHDYIMKDNLSRLIPAVERELSEAQMRREKRLAEERLAESEQLFRSIFENSVDAILLTVPDGRILTANPAACRMFGRSEVEICRIGWNGLIDYADRHASEACSKGKTESVYSGGEYYHIRRDGTRFPTEVSIGGFLDKDGRKKSIVMIRDITHRKEAEHRLRESEERYRTAIENSNDGVALVKDGKHIYVNGKFLEIFGYDNPDDVIGKSTSVVIHPDYHEQQKDFSRRRKEGKQAPNRFEFKGIKKDGTEVFIEASVSETIYEGEQVLFVFSRDITERKKAADELARTTEKLRRSFIGTLQAVAHTVEMKDPYTAGHQKRVARIARAIAQEMGLAAAMIDNIRMAGAIHDIGKISVPSEILSKPTKLSDVEMAIIKTHSQTGYDILKGTELPQIIGGIILQHHERLDGSGYPNSLKGEEILLEARILAVADVVEAMAFYRPYRPAMGIDVALSEIVKNKGILYDSRVVEVCLTIFREKCFDFEKDGA